jgi:hypothetical protein
LGRHGLYPILIHIQLRRDLLVGQIQAHEIQTQYPHAQWLMMPFKDRSCQVIKLPITGLAFLGHVGRN